MKAKAKIIEKQEIAQGTLMVTFDLLGEQLQFSAGQYFFITLPKLLYPDEKGPRRHFSIVNSPNEKGILSMATRITGSGFKKTLSELPVGTEVEVGPIAGVFVLPQNFNQPLVLIAGGIGITPYISMLRFIAEEKLPVNITLIYSNRNQGSTPFLKEIQHLTKQIPQFKLVLTMTEDNEWVGEKKKVDGQFIKEYTKDLQAPYYMVVGPPLMTDAVVEELKRIGIEDQNLKIEKFTGYR
ncbi:MAG: FAD-dependent oxidoreductase [Patescibacteria group bacterium]